MTTPEITDHIDDEALLDILQTSIYPGESRDTVRAVRDYCNALGLSALQNPVYLARANPADPDDPRRIIRPRAGLYRMLAMRHGCAGIDEPEYGPEATEVINGQTVTFPTWCRVTVRRRMDTGEVAEFSAREYWRENRIVLADGSLDDAWARRPYALLGARAETQALRRGFPESCTAPTAEELDGLSMTTPAPAAPAAGKKPKVTPPQRKSAAATTVVAQPAPEAAAAPAAAGKAASTARRGGKRTSKATAATAGEVALISRRIAQTGLTIAQARQRAGLAAGGTLDGITTADFLALNAALNEEAQS